LAEYLTTWTWKEKPMIRNGVAMLLVAMLAAAPPLAATAQAPQAPSAADAVSPEAAEAVKVVDAFHAALAKNDPTTALAALSENVLIFEGGYVERSKAEYGSHHLGADAAFASAVPSSLVRRSAFAAGDTAWVASETRTTGRYKDKAVDRLSTESTVLKKEATGWRIVHIHWSSRPAS
jgi:ketosteroid isomerase-like protein